MARVSVKVEVSLESWTPFLVPGLPELMLKMKAEAPDYLYFIFLANFNFVFAGFSFQ